MIPEQLMRALAEAKKLTPVELEMLINVAGLMKKEKEMAPAYALLVMEDGGRAEDPDTDMLVRSPDNSGGLLIKNS